VPQEGPGRKDNYTKKDGRYWKGIPPFTELLKAPALNHPKCLAGHWQDRSLPHLPARCGSGPRLRLKAGFTMRMSTPSSRPVQQQANTFKVHCPQPQTPKSSWTRGLKDFLNRL